MQSMRKIVLKGQQILCDVKVNLKFISYRLVQVNPILTEFIDFIDYFVEK